MQYTFGLIGSGNMGGAIARAVSHTTKEGILADHFPQRAKELAQELGLAAGDNQTAARESQYLFLGVKPHLMGDMLTAIQPVLASRDQAPVLVSMAAGLTIAQIQQMAGQEYPVIRIMPNTPASIGKGMILYTVGKGVSAPERKTFLTDMAAAGRFSELPEHLMDAGSAVSGCGPAFADLFLEALADGGVACGLSRALALESAAQMMIGTAKLMLETGKHPGELKDAVCSPGGATIQGIRALEEAGFRGAVMNAVIAAWEKSKGM